MRVALVFLGRIRTVLDVASLCLLAVLGGMVAIAVAPAVVWCFGFGFQLGSFCDLIGQVAV